MKLTAAPAGRTLYGVHMMGYRGCREAVEDFIPQFLRIQLPNVTVSAQRTLQIMLQCNSLMIRYSGVLTSVWQLRVNG